MSKHTEGPWRAELITERKRGRETQHWSVWGKVHIAVVSSQVRAEGEKATAHLLAAAWEMDAAIRALLADYDAGVFEQHATLHPVARRRIEALRAALPKEGE